MKKFIKILKSISLSQKEKDVLRYKIEQFISFNPIRNEIHIPKKSFYFSIFTFRTLAKGVSLVLIALIVVGGTGVSYASTDALPGDRLYNVKINVNEKIEEKLALTAEARVTVQTQKVERRLTEAQTLVERNDLSPANKEIVKVNLEKNITSVARSIENLKNEGKIEKALDTASRVTPVLEAHKKALTEQKALEIEALEIESEFEPSDDFVVVSSLSESTTTSSQMDSLLISVSEAIEKVEEVEKRVIEKVNEDQETAEKLTEKNRVELTEKIENLKRENLETRKEEANILESVKSGETELAEKENNDVEGLAKTDILLKTKEIVGETYIEIAEEIPTLEIKSDSEVEIKIKQAEDLLIQGEDFRVKGDFREALRLSQQARKIIREIEEYRKIKKAELVSQNKNQEKPTEQKTEEVIQDEKEAVNTKEDIKVEELIQVEINNEIKIDAPVIDIKAEAIKSLEETNASLKKINLSQSIQTHLLP